MPTQVPQVIFAFLEDGTLELHPGCEAAALAYEGIDVESGVVKFYDSSGQYLSPRFLVPNISKSILGLIRWVESGKYELETDPTANEDGFALALYETAHLEPNEFFTSMDALKADLRGQGVPVDWPPVGVPSDASQETPSK